MFAAAALTIGSNAQDRWRDASNGDPEADGVRLAREQWFYSQRSYPLGRIPTGARLKAINALHVLERSHAAQRAPGALAAGASAWTLIGPQPTDQNLPYVSSGRVNAVAVDPRDNNTVYIGAAEGGVWKTSDGGATWTPLTDQQASLATGAIALDPSNPDTVYVGTGEDNSSGDSYYGAGILKSADGGNTWTNIVGPFLRDRIAAIAVHPSDGKTVLCASFAGLWRSTDAGATWSRVLPTPASATGAATEVFFDPADGSVAYAGVNFGTGKGNGVYKSVDSGATWKQLTGSGANSLPGSNVGRVEIAIAPSTPSTLYAMIGDSSTANGQALLGIWKSLDSGDTWNQLTSVPAAAFGKQLWYTNVLGVDPTNADVVIAGALLLYRTLDGGNTWQALPQTGPNGIELHVDEHALTFTPDGSKLYIGNDGGMYSATAVDGARVSWTALNDTLALTQFYPGMSLDPQDAQFSLIGTQDNETQIYAGALSWSTFTCGDGAGAAVDRLTSQILYTACASGTIGGYPIAILKSPDGGNSNFLAQYGIDESDREQFIPPLVLDNANPRTLYYGTVRVWQSVDGAGRWNAISPDLTNGSYTIKSMAIAPSDSSTVYAATGTTNSATDPSFTTPRRGLLQVTRNALAGSGAVWTQAAAAGLPIRSITRVAVDPIDPQTVYVVVSGFGTGHVFRSADAGASFSDISSDLPDLPVNDIVVDPDLPDTLYIATDAGVMVTSNAGGAWLPLGSGLPQVVVQGIALHRGARILRAATHGRSAWDIPVPLVSASLQPHIASLSPNLVNAGSGDLTLLVNGSNLVAGDIVRCNGENLATTFLSPGQLRAQVPAADLALPGRATITVFLPSTGGGASNQLDLSIGPAPAATNQSAVSDANPAGGGVLAQRSIASVYGLNLAAETSLADAAPPLPWTLGDTTLTLGGNGVPLFFISPTQINFQVPFLSVSRNTPEPLVIKHGDLSVTITVTLGQYAPALFTTNSQGSGQGSILISGTSSLAAPDGAFPGSRPASAGEFISIYCTGLGDVSSRPGLGSPSPANPLSRTLTSPTVTIGGMNAPVTFSGLAPGYVGLYQVNAQIPAGAPSGDAVAVVLSIAGLTSNTATIAIQ